MKRLSIAVAGAVFAFCVLPTALAETTNSAAVVPLTTPNLPEVGPSVLRVLGALAVVLGIFLGGVWLFRNWQRLALGRGRVPRLNVLETRPLGGRQALYVVGYESERFLIASSPAGVSLLSHLPAAAENDASPSAAPASSSFAQALTQVLKGK